MKTTTDSAGGRAVPQINVTPLIDVLLVLLIIFMVLSPLRPARFKALVPAEPPPQVHIEPNPWTLVVQIDAQARLRLNQSDVLGTTADAGPLVARLADTLNRRAAELHGGPPPPGMPSARTVFLKAPRGLSYGEVARVIDAVKGAGADPVGLQIDDLQ
ncbi:MAG TPA: biopolymer transporter ExbD [Pyrinomonadaceae bacterium]|jgi:biopolymer transport protein ExbD